jgi:hypothetical protein
MLRSSNSAPIKESDSLNIDIPVADITCPISEEIFFEPEMAVPCGHIFEKDEIKQWMTSKSTCPCCRSEIEKTVNAPPVLHNLLESLLSKYPKLQQQRYFSHQIIARALKASDQVKLEKIVKFLTLADHRLNEMGGGNSILYCLVEQSLGLSLLIKNNELRNKITSKSLNYASVRDADAGSTILIWFAGFNEGLEILKTDKVLRDKITPQGLNNIVSGSIDHGTSAFYWFAKSKTGREILGEDAILRAKVTEEGMNSVRSCKDYKRDQDTGSSAAFFLAKSPEGLALLFNDEALRVKINAKGLNSICVDQEFQGLSLVYVLAHSQRGRELLSKDERLRSLIDPSALFSKAAASDKSAADWLMSEPDGRQLLELDPVLRNKVYPGTDKSHSGIANLTDLFRHHHHHHHAHDKSNLEHAPAPAPK